VAHGLNWDSSDFLACISSELFERRYDEENQEATRRGVFGVPTMIIDDKMWWGNDRIIFVEEYLAETAPSDKR
jgi:2-hydroxychromene-2-carboxylate isomerase